jgi:hypothetical protein
MPFPHKTSNLLLTVLVIVVSALYGDLRIAPGTAGGHELSWDTEVGRHYTLSQSDDLVYWSTVPGYPEEAASDLGVHSIATSGSAKFYRVSEVTVSETVSWSIGRPDSSIDGGALSGPVTFTWTFDRPVEHGVYADGTPWVVWQEGLRLIAVDPDRISLDIPYVGATTLENAVVDATCINPAYGELPLDARMGGLDGTGVPWGNGTHVWDGNPLVVNIGDTIVTGRGRRDARDRERQMLFTAIGTCNVVGWDMSGRYRPPLRMPASLRAWLIPPEQVDATGLPAFPGRDWKDWNGNPVNLDLSSAIQNLEADDLLNGPIGNCGVFPHVVYEFSNGMLNHDVRGTEDGAYQRDVSDRIAACLYAAFDPDRDPQSRQRNLDKFIQVGLDYYAMHCLGYPVWNGGGGHVNGIEGTITITGALLGDAEMVRSIKYQRFMGSAVGDPGPVYDFFGGFQGDFTRSEACHFVESAAWQSGDFIKRSVDDGAESLEETVVRIDMARPDMVLNNASVPYTGISSIGQTSAITVSPSFAWPMYTENAGTEAKRGYRYLPGAVMRIEGDTTIRTIVAFQQSAGTDWTESTWDAAGGTGGVMMVYPALDPAEIASLGTAGLFVTGVTTRDLAGTVVLWESWPATDPDRVRRSFFVSPVQDYLNNKIGDQLHWMPFYPILGDPSAPGKQLHEESVTFRQMRKFLQYLRDSGTAIWDPFATGANTPDTPTNQALVRFYLLDGQMPATYGREYDPDDALWVDVD